MKHLHKTSFFALFVFLLSFGLCSCHHNRVVNTSFYYWKTVYKANKTEASYLQHFHSNNLYVRIMDVDVGDDGVRPVPVSPIVFHDKLPDSVQIIPVVFIVNNTLKTTTHPQLDDLAHKIISFVNGKVQQAGKTTYNELQIDCDWTATTRENYFYLLRQIRAVKALKATTLSATLRLHQLKNQQGSGIPPVNRVMLMCYNMGNLRKYGNQNSILDLAELKKYANQNISAYSLPVDVGLPLFSWAVAFRNKTYIGISKRINKHGLDDKNQFIFMGDNMYAAQTDLPQYGLTKADEIRWETVTPNDLQAVAGYLSPLIKADSLNVIYFHLDEANLKEYTYDDLEKTNHIFR